MAKVCRVRASDHLACRRRSEQVSKASYQIDRDLRFHAEEKGTPLSEGLWVIERNPLRAVFEIKEEDRLVRVVSLAIVKMP